VAWKKKFGFKKRKVLKVKVERKVIRRILKFNEQLLTHLILPMFTFLEIYKVPLLLSLHLLSLLIFTTYRKYKMYISLTN